jgi:hypothetical protein
MQCKDIPDAPILKFLAELESRGWGIGATWYDGYPQSITQAMPPDTPPKLVRAKMASMIRRGLVHGCSCGCRGDYTIQEQP